jgi:hypothetical protein
MITPEELRKLVNKTDTNTPVYADELVGALLEAADEIERLQEEVRRLSATGMYIVGPGYFNPRE